MIYLDNAATTAIKPPSVVNTFTNSIKKFSFNPGRGGYRQSIETANAIYSCRKAVKDLVNCDDESNVCFTMNCTHAINTVIYGTLQRDDHVIVSSLEHNAVIRPIYGMYADNGISYSVAKVESSPENTVINFEKAINHKTKLIIVTAASNVIGRVLPLKEIGDLCKKYGISFAVDGAQGTGVLPINMKEMNIDYLCIAPHKGLYAPMGLGILVARKPINNVLIKGGTGINSIELTQPTELPERIESGTVNVPAIIATKAGIDFVNSKRIYNIYSHELELCKMLYDNLKRLNADLYSERPEFEFHAPVLSFNYKGRSSEEIGEMLAKRNIAVRCGLHCAPLAHKQLDTLKTGTVRVSPSVFNNTNDIENLIFVLKSVI